MSRALVILRNDADRLKAAAWCRNAPRNTRVLFQETKRTLPQNSILHAMLTEIAAQKTHCGVKMPPDDWKCLFMGALGKEARVVPSLDGTGFVPLGYRSSELSVSEMSDLIELMKMWGAQNGVVFRDEEAA